MASRIARPNVEKRARASATEVPQYEAQLATLVDKPPSGDSWIHELKYDGYRMGCAVRGRDVTLESRNGKDWTAAFPDVVASVAALKLGTALLDGEVAILMPDGRTSFQALQNSFSGGSRRGLKFFVFDCLFLGGEDLRALPLAERKERLAAALPASDVVRYSEHLEGDGAAMLAGACALGAEGIISKRRDNPYRPGRNDDWQKSKCLKRQEFVIAGFTEPEGSRSGVGALLLGFYQGDVLVFAGKVGTGKGFTARFLTQLRAELERLVQSQCPFAKKPPARYSSRAHWLRPERVGEVAFTEWTADGHVRHPSFLGFRADKSARDVAREEPSKGSRDAR